MAKTEFKARLDDGWDPLESVLSKQPELRAEWEELEDQQARVLESFQKSMVATDLKEATEHAMFVARTLPSLTVRRVAAKTVIVALMARELPPPFRVSGVPS